MPIAPRVYQVNQTNLEETRSGVLCAPDKVNAAGHQLMRELRAGDVLFHYNSRLRKTHAVSIVEPITVDDRRLDRWRHRIRTVSKVNACCIEYQGAHLTLDDQPSEQKRFLAAVTRIIKNVDLENAFPSALIYLREIGGLDAERRRIIATLSSTRR